ncbi:hypothetical protein M1N44_01915 [Dehalococcoidia bacterium]|nr:hypothetical protein [Dehalococcoidia bacterium]
METALLKKPTKRAMLRGTALLIGLLSAALLLHNQALAFSFANYLSTKIIERAPNTQLVIGREGVANPNLNVVMGPQVSTLAPIDISMNGETRATLRGELLDLRGFPQVTIWFEWGYDETFGNTVGNRIVSSTGIYSHTITNFDPARNLIFYRFVGQTDGTNRTNLTNAGISRERYFELLNQVK